MKCNQCKEEVDVLKWKYCPHCGGKLTDEKIIYEIFKLLHSKGVIFGIIFFEIGFIAVVGVLLANSWQKYQQKNQEITAMLENKEEISVDWNVKDKIFPITYAGENQKLVELKVTSPSFSKLKAEVSADGFTSVETKILNVKPGGNIFNLGPNLTTEGLIKLKESQNVMVHLKLSTVEEGDSLKEVINDKKETFFYSKNDIRWQEQGQSNAKYIVRLINKDRDEVKGVVRKAADHMKELGGENNAMLGALGGKEEAKRQLKAIFLAISKDLDVRYVMAPFSYDSMQVQKVKAPEEVLQTKSGLCIELSLLVAAALENVGLNPVIVVTSGHAWPGVQLDSVSEEYAFIEATMLEDTAEEASEAAQSNWNTVKNDPGSYRLVKVADLRTDEDLIPFKY